MENYHRPFYTFLLSIKKTNFHDQYLLKDIFNYIYDDIFIKYDYFFKFNSKCLRRVMHTINYLITINNKDLFDFTLMLAKKLNANLNGTNIAIYPRIRGITCNKKYKNSDENDMYYIEKLKEYGHKFGIGYYGYDTMIYNHLKDNYLRIIRFYLNSSSKPFDEMIEGKTKEFLQKNPKIILDLPKDDIIYKSLKSYISSDIPDHSTTLS